MGDGFTITIFLRPHFLLSCTRAAMFSSDVERESLSAVMIASKLILLGAVDGTVQSNVTIFALPASTVSTTLCGLICFHGELLGSTLFGKLFQKPVGRFGKATADSAKKIFTATLDAGLIPRLCT